MAIPAMAIGALAEVGLGTWQIAQGAKLRKEAGDRPEYQMPQEILQSLNMAQRSAYEGLPAEQKKQFVENLRAMQSTGLSQLSDRKSGLAGVGNLAASATEGYRNLLSMDAQQRQANQQMYMSQLENVAGYKDLEFQTNQLQPYQQTLAESKAMTGSGIQNVFGAIGGLGQAYNYNNQMSQANNFLNNSDRLKGSELSMNLDTSMTPSSTPTATSSNNILGGGGISSLGGTNQWYTPTIIGQ